MAEKWLIFVDTNILLDFYRLPGESAERQLQALERHKDVLITSDQVRMEFLKNRQKVITESFGKVEKPKNSVLPSILSDFQPAKMLAKHQRNAASQYDKVTNKVEKIIKNPSGNDDVFKRLNKIFDYETPYNLKRPDRVRFTIRRLARKRFVLGYPPRKSQDTSIGDAVNWEWVVHCAQMTSPN